MTNLDSRAGLRWVVVTATLVAGAVFSVGGQSTFRATVDLIAVDVQVVNDKGVPILGLGPEKFEVSINGKKRNVVSADLLRFDEDTLTLAAGSPLPQAAAPTKTFTESSPSDGRVFVIAIDALSFQPAATRDIKEAARKFVEQLQPNDLVGLMSFPSGRKMDVTTSHAQVLRELDSVVGEGDPPAMNTYQLTPSEVVDLTSFLARGVRGEQEAEFQRTLQEICAGDPSPATCRVLVTGDASAIAATEEGLALQRIGSLREMLRSLAPNPRRKTIVLVSTGILTTDRPGGKPDIEDLGRLIGQEAGRANATIYVLHVDQQRNQLGSASSTRRARPGDSFSRDSAIMARPLDQITAASGGTLFRVVQGGGEFAFDRIVKETAAYYLLGVEPDTADRDGKPRTLRVKADTNQKGTTVRARSWVVVPSR